MTEDKRKYKTNEGKKTREIKKDIYCQAYKEVTTSAINSMLTWENIFWKIVLLILTQLLY